MSHNFSLENVNQIKNTSRIYQYVGWIPLRIKLLKPTYKNIAKYFVKCYYMDRQQNIGAREILGVLWLVC